jgi:glycosyltransferase involved in cell wall biosynthesis
LIHEHREHTPDPAAEGRPFVSVLIPVRNEAGFIGDCLRALAGQDYPRERFEVLVLDGESTDGTVAEVETIAQNYGVPDALLTNRGHTTATGLNLGLSIASGSIIVRVDGHCVVDPTFISASVAALEKSGADAVGGPIRTRGNGAAGEAIALAVSSPFGVGDAAFRHATSEQETDSVAFAAYRREVFEKIGGFAEDIDRGEDDDFNYRLRDSGGRILLTPAIGSVYYARDSLGGLARQYWGYGIAKARVLHRHPGRLRARHLVPSAFFTALAGSAVLAPFSGSARLVFKLTAGSYAIAAGLAALRIANRAGSRHLPLLPPAFATVHLAAGAGFIAGWWRELRKNRG